MLILQDYQLDVNCADVIFLRAVQQFCLERYCKPAWGLFHLQVVNFLQVLQVVSRPNWNLARGIRLVTFEIQVYGNLLNSGFLHKLNVDQVGLRPIRLPKSVCIVVSELFDPIARFCWAQSPNCVNSDFSTLVVVGRGRCGLRKGVCVDILNYFGPSLFEMFKYWSYYGMTNI